MKHWSAWFLAFLTTIGAGVFLLPLFRVYPESLHAFFHSLSAWQRQLFLFSLCTWIAYSLFQVFWPRTAHLRYFLFHPPMWLAVVFGVLCVATADLLIGLSPGIHTSTVWEWIFYAGGPTSLVSLHTWLTSSEERADPKPLDLSESQSNDSPLDWSFMETWLSSDAPAEIDFLGNYAVAVRLRDMLICGTRSIGVVGPFGVGKTSIVGWMIGFSDSHLNNGMPQLVFSQHSCWGFDNSASAIHTMLADGIDQVAQRIDTFRVSSLPESYRQTFSAGGEWFDSISKLIFGQRDPLEQFQYLSDLLGDMNARLVFVVEDLDRNNSRSFDIQEILAFLQQLKAFPNLSFVLTGGLGTVPKIDFAKLCDHIEYLKTFSIEESTALISRLRDRSLDPAIFPHHAVIHEEDNEWSPDRWLLTSGVGAIRPPEALARLLNTPRSLRHALGRTYSAWQALSGEVDWDHLLALNVLRHGAPEAFSFLLRHWHRFHTSPALTTARNEQLQESRSALRQEWDEIVHQAEWDDKAAHALIDFVLPTTQLWFGDDGTMIAQRPQGIQQARHWYRAVNETIDPDDVRDQRVLEDISEWLQVPSPQAKLVLGLTESEAYAVIWEDFAYRYFGNDTPRILLLCSHVLKRIRELDGSAASRESEGFGAVWRYASRYTDYLEENRRWLEAEISASVRVSLELVNDLWRYFGSPGEYALLRPEDVTTVRQHRMRMLREYLVDGNALLQVVHPNYSYVLYQLVFEPDHDPESVIEFPAWRWLGPVIVEALRQENTTIAIAVTSLIAARNADTRQEHWSVDCRVLDGIFAKEAQEVIELLAKLAPIVEKQSHREFVTAIAKSGAFTLTD